MTALAIPVQHNAKYLVIAQTALRQRLTDRSALAARAVFYVVVLFIFSRMWQRLSLDGSRYVWYLAVTEWVLLSQPRLFVEIERDVRSGEIAYQLTRPSSYLALRLAEGAAEMLLSMAVLGLVGAATATVLTFGAPAEPLGLLFACVLGLLAGGLLLLCSALIGLSAFWLQDCSPLYWLWQKSVFVLGGLFVPLTLYPAWLRALALWTPFSAMVSGPGSMVLVADGRLFGLLALKLLACSVMVGHALVAAYGRAVQHLEVNGG